MKALITGAAGFIGSNLLKRCLDLGWDVHGVDDLSNGHLEFVPNGVNFSITDFSNDAVLGAVRKKEFDAVFHIAALPRVSYSVEHPFKTNDVNVTRTLKLLEACRGNTGRFVFASSSSVYGGAVELPTTESSPKQPKSPYALQKSIIEDYLTLWCELYGMDSASLRFFNVFGPNQLGDSPYATAVAAWLTAIHSGKPMRSDGDGTQTRDMCYVDNVVDACVLAATHGGKLGADCFNVACGDRTSNNEILDRLTVRYPYAEKYDAPWRAGDVMHTQADISKITAVLGYKPTVRVAEGIEKTIGWYEREWKNVANMKLKV